jgi:hypothetical protein
MYSIEIEVKNATNLLRLFRNVVKDYKVWLKADLVFDKAIKSKNFDGQMNKSDCLDAMNILAFKEVQNIDTWQFLSEKYLEHMLNDQLDMHDIVSGAICLKSVSIKAPELYEMIVNYFEYK